MAYKKSGETRDRLLKAADKMFAERGYYETGVGDIAKEAGIGRASFYYYYEDKEKAARAVFDSYIDRIYAAADKAIPTKAAEAGLEDTETVLLRTFVKYILLFKYIALNKATHAVYYDLVNYADYDEANIARLKRTTYKDTRGLAAAFGRRLSDAEFVAFIISTNSVAKSIFKAMSNGILGFSMEEATDFFFRHAVLPDIPIPESHYQALRAKALGICEGITLD